MIKDPPHLAITEKIMTSYLKALSYCAILCLSACSAPTIKPNETTSAAAVTPAPATPEANSIGGLAPPMTVIKNNQKLALVRVMDGGMCKNDYQGAKGAFLLYANPDDIERIKREKGAAIFKSFESKIEQLSGDVLHTALEQTNLAEDPFALGADEAQEKLAKTLVNNFRQAAVGAITSFQQETSLTIDITAFPPSLVFYQKGCSASQIDPETEDSNG